jgi:hypothetical protein
MAMTANAFVNGLGLIWLAMMVLSVAVPVYLGVAHDDDGRGGWIIISVILLQAYALIPALASMILRLVLDKRLTGSARWFGFVPGSVSGVLLLLAGIAGWLIPE